MIKLHVLKGILVCSALTIVFSGCALTPKIGKNIKSYKLIDGIYEGSYTGGPNAAKVKVTIEHQKIKNIEIVEHRALKGRKAEPIIPRLIIEKQSTNVDAVTGATNSSHVLMNAVQKAIEKSYNNTD